MRTQKAKAKQKKNLSFILSFPFLIFYNPGYLLFARIFLKNKVEVVVQTFVGTSIAPLNPWNFRRFTLSLNSVVSFANLAARRL